jgi:hypothetical protein
MRRAVSPRSSKEPDDLFAEVTIPVKPKRNAPRRRGMRPVLPGWKAEKILLLALFIGASVGGYFTSSWVWQVQLTGVYLL